MKGIKKQHHSDFQGPLSDLPPLHVADESNMAAEMAELEICRYPGKARSNVREYLVFINWRKGPKQKKTWMWRR